MPFGLEYWEQLFPTCTRAGGLLRLEESVQSRGFRNVLRGQREVGRDHEVKGHLDSNVAMNLGNLKSTASMLPLLIAAVVVFGWGGENQLSHGSLPESG